MLLRQRKRVNGVGGSANRTEELWAPFSPWGIRVTSSLNREGPLDGELTASGKCPQMVFML